MKKILGLLCGGLLALLLAAPYIIFSQEIRELGALGYAGVFVSCLLANAALFVPTSSMLIVAAASYTLSPVLCVLAGGLGTAIGEQAAYICGRTAASGFAQENSSCPPAVVRWMENNAFATVFFFALLPLPLFDLVGVMAGARRMSWLQYTAAAAMGKVLKFAIVIFALKTMTPILAERGVMDYVNAVLYTPSGV